VAPLSWVSFCNASHLATGGTELENTTGDPRLDRDPTPDRPLDRDPKPDYTGLDRGKVVKRPQGTNFPEFQVTVSWEQLGGNAILRYSEDPI